MPYVPPPESGQFKPGQSGNPGGRPKGARTRLQGKFLNSLADDFDQHGKQAIIDMREKDPVAYVRAVASLMPKQVEETKPLDDMTDAELVAGIAFLKSRLVAGAGEGISQAQVSQSVN